MPRFDTFTNMPFYDDRNEIRGRRFLFKNLNDINLKKIVLDTGEVGKEEVRKNHCISSNHPKVA